MLILHRSPTKRPHRAGGGVLACVTIAHVAVLNRLEPYDIDPPPSSRTDRGTKHGGGGGLNYPSGDRTTLPRTTCTTISTDDNTSPPLPKHSVALTPHPSLIPSTHAILLLQRAIRTFLTRSRFVTARRAVIVVQARARCKAERSRYTRRRAALIVALCWEEAVAEEEKETEEGVTMDDPVDVGPVEEEAECGGSDDGDGDSETLRYLRKEVFALRIQNARLMSDNDLTKENNRRLVDANASAGVSYAALTRRTERLGRANGRLRQEVERYGQQAHDRKPGEEIVWTGRRQGGGGCVRAIVDEAHFVYRPEDDVFYCRRHCPTTVSL